MKDEKTGKIFTQFGKNYLEAQHYSEYIEGGAEAVFGVILTVLTAGIGGVAAAGAAGARLASTAGKLAPMVKNLSKLLKRKRGKKNHSGDTNTRLESKNTQKLSRTERENLVRKRPARYRKGVVDDVWKNAKGPDGKIRDLTLGRFLNGTNQKTVMVNGIWDTRKVLVHMMTLKSNS